MVLLLGHTGYIGEAFRAELRKRKITYAYPNGGIKQCDYTKFGVLRDLVKLHRPNFIINAAGFTGKPNVDACESQRSDAILGNIVFAQTLANVCEAEGGIPFGHVSSGCIYAGCTIISKAFGAFDHKDLSHPHMIEAFETNASNIEFSGYSEDTAPNFTFDDPPCSFYSGTKALAEEVLGDAPGAFIWRLRIPFDQYNGPRNYLTKLQTYPKIYNNINSLSHRGDFVSACLDLWQNGADYGTYNVTNPGAVSTKQVVELIKQYRGTNKQFEFWKDDAEFYSQGAIAPRSNCILDTTKLLNAGVKMRPVADALIDALTNWTP